MQKNLSAFTSTETAYPAYISINRIDYGYVEITVRGSGFYDEQQNFQQGNVVAIKLTSTEFNALIGGVIINGA